MNIGEGLDFGPDRPSPAVALLTPSERALMDAWRAGSGGRRGATGVPAIGVLQGFVESSGIRRVVELGRLEGHGTLLIGFMLRRMGVKQGLISFDLDHVTTARVREWIGRARLQPQVRVAIGDSRDPTSAAHAIEYLGGAPQLIFLDTSHERSQTLAELALWYGVLTPGGLILMHDSSAFAEQWDPSGHGGVRAALRQWAAANPDAQVLNLNGDLTEWGTGVYADGNGLAIVAKPVRS